MTSTLSAPACCTCCARMQVKEGGKPCKTAKAELEKKLKEAADKEL